MRVIKGSASSINSYRNCSFYYFMHYILGMQSRAGKAALQGSIVHKTLELMARRTKRGKKEIDPMLFLNYVWDKLIKKSPEIEIRRVTTRIDKSTGDFKEAADFKKCRLVLETILADPFYNPYNLKVVDVEKWFALEMPGDVWECSDKDGKLHQFTIRGFIDLVHEIDKDTIEIVDWKTGARKNFYTQQPIDELALTNEIQSRLYHLAAYFLYPQYENIFITFYYTGDGPVTIALSHDDLAITISILHRFFTTIRDDTLIQRNKSWKCKMCSFYKGDVCSRVWSDYHTMGSEYVEDRYTDLSCENQLSIGGKL